MKSCRKLPASVVVELHGVVTGNSVTAYIFNSNQKPYKGNIMTEQEAITAKKQLLIKKHQAELAAAEEEARAAFRSVKAQIAMLEDLRVSQIDAVNTSINRKIAEVKAQAGLVENKTENNQAEDIPPPRIN